MMWHGQSPNGGRNKRRVELLCFPSLHLHPYGGWCTLPCKYSYSISSPMWRENGHLSPLFPSGTSPTRCSYCAAECLVDGSGHLLRTAQVCAFRRSLELSRLCANVSSVAAKHADAVLPEALFYTICWLVPFVSVGEEPVHPFTLQ